MMQDNSAVSQAIFHQVHTPRQELSTSSKLDGDQNGERNATRTLFSGSVFSGGHGQGTPKFAKDQGVGRVMRRNSFSGPEFSTGRKASSFDRDTSGHLAAVLSKVNASDFPKLDFESEQSRAGAAESWMQLMGLKMSAVSTEVADYLECTEHEVRGKYEMYCVHLRWQGDMFKQAHYWNRGSSSLKDVSDPLFLTLFQGQCRKWP